MTQPSVTLNSLPVGADAKNAKMSLIKDTKNVIFQKAVARLSLFGFSFMSAAFLLGTIAKRGLNGDELVFRVGFGIGGISCIFVLYVHYSVHKLHGALNGVLQLCQNEQEVREKVQNMMSLTTRNDQEQSADSIADAVIGPVRNEIKNVFLVLHIGPAVGLTIIGVILAGVRFGVQDDTLQMWIGAGNSPSVVLILAVVLIAVSFPVLYVNRAIYNGVMNEADARIVKPWSSTFRLMISQLIWDQTLKATENGTVDRE